MASSHPSPSPHVTHKDPDQDPEFAYEPCTPPLNYLDWNSHNKFKYSTPLSSAESSSILLSAPMDGSQQQQDRRPWEWGPEKHLDGTVLRLGLDLPPAQTTQSSTATAFSSPLNATATNTNKASRSRTQSPGASVIVPPTPRLLSNSFRCTVPNCNKSYKQANELAFHINFGSCGSSPRRHLRDINVYSPTNTSLTPAPIQEEQKEGKFSANHQCPNKLLEHPSVHHDRALPNKTNKSGGGIYEHDLFLHACEVLKVVCSEKVKYKRLVNLERSTAQSVLDVIQAILDHASTILLDSQLENILLKAMLHLSKHSTLCPTPYVLSDIKRDEYPITAGHFGEIFKGDYSGRKVSLKVFKLYSNHMSKIDDLLKAFYKEAILWRHLVHPNLLPFYGIYQLGDSGGRICLVSPWMDNGNVIQYLQQYPDVNRQQLILDIAQGVSYLHGKSFVHGDLKGVNVLISDTGVACLGDFGLSSIINTHSLALTSMETSIFNSGTVRWQAPELIDTEDKPIVGATKETDVYAFGCVCYEVLTGKIPFYQYTLDATVILKVMTGQRPLRPEFSSERGLTDWMWSLIEECWDRDPIKRPMASEVLAKLYSEEGFSRDVVSGSDWGDLQPHVFKSLLNQHSTVSDSDIKDCISLLSSL